MTDQELQQQKNRLRLQQRLEKVTPELFSAFLQAKGVPVVACPICHNDDLAIPQASILQVGPEGSQGHNYVDYVKVSTDGPPFSLMNYQYRLICKNCAYTMNFTVWPILKWVEDKLSSEESDDNVKS